MGKGAFASAGDNITAKVVELWGNTTNGVKNASIKTWEVSSKGVATTWDNTAKGVTGAWDNTAKGVSGAWGNTTQGVAGAWDKVRAPGKDSSAAAGEDDALKVSASTASLEANAWQYNAYGTAATPTGAVEGKPEKKLKFGLPKLELPKRAPKPNIPVESEANKPTPPQEAVTNGSTAVDSAADDAAPTQEPEKKSAVEQMVAQIESKA